VAGYIPVPIWCSGTVKRVKNELKFLENRKVIMYKWMSGVVKATILKIQYSQIWKVVDGMNSVNRCAKVHTAMSSCCREWRLANQETSDEYDIKKISVLHELLNSNLYHCQYGKSWRWLKSIQHAWCYRHINHIHTCIKTWLYLFSCQIYITHEPQSYLPINF
jgi:hypothetical protein